MREHQDDFLPFLASVDGEDMPGATDDGIMTPEQYKEYCHRVESTAEWGGEPEVCYLVACRAIARIADDERMSGSSRRTTACAACG